MLTKKGKDVNVLDIDKSNYLVPTGEEHLYHVKIEVKEFSRTTGERLSVPRIQKFGIKEFETMVRSSLKRHGWTIEVLHDPHEWLEKQKQLNDEQKAIAQQELEQAKAEQKQKEIKEAVAAALAEQEAENKKKVDEAVAAELAKIKNSKVDK